jgi:hypothetical protein
VNLRPNLKDSRYVVYYDLLLHLQQREEADEENDAKHGDSKADAPPLIYREESDGTYDMDVIPRKRNLLGGSKDEPGLDEVLEEEVNRASTKTRTIHK